MTSNTIVSLNKIRFHPKSDSKRRPRLCPFRDQISHFSRWRKTKCNDSHRAYARSRERETPLSLSLSATKVYRMQCESQSTKKNVRNVPLYRRLNLLLVWRLEPKMRRERERDKHKLNPKHISNTLNKKKLQLICSQSALTLPSDWRSSEHHANESFFPRATCIIARQWERAFWWILAAERFLFESI